ncbi:hypothetical protein H6781_01015 [Candidatus Nomurabacteria bacterium]|nr:hypothetical protein [Candidatus Kaiserbacteria bacterium]MCB9810161.1 hypothetical protein [Candidatus Nomurabacteria bacterium]MCB9815659.1 hypothetical protein [Candidatus Nomurabacteria bacterium]MCB9818264.1 hypothetical protein [Candidatus Nomurabacteria bacterium]
MKKIADFSLEELLVASISDKNDPVCGTGEHYPIYNEVTHGEQHFYLPRIARNIYTYEVATLDEIEELSIKLNILPGDASIEVGDEIGFTISELMVKYAALKNNRNWFITQMLMLNETDVWEEDLKYSEEEIDYEIFSNWIFTIVCCSEDSIPGENVLEEKPLILN